MRRVHRRLALAAALAAGAAIAPGARADIAKQIALFGPATPNWVPTAGGQAPADYESFATGRYWAGGAVQSGFAGFLGATGYGFSRGSAATFVNGAGLIATAASGAARFVYDPSTLAAQGILLEGARSNIALQSQNFAAATWSPTGLTSINATAAAAPDGTNTANLFTEDTVNTIHRVFQSSGTATTSGVNYSVSAWLKPGTSNYAFLSTVSRATANAGVSQAFDMSAAAGALGGNHVGSTSGAFAAASLAPGAGGWYLGAVTGNVAVTDLSAAFGLAPATGLTWANNGAPTYAGTSRTLLAWGVQQELGAFPSSYIPTTSAAATRSADGLTRSHPCPAALTAAFGATTPAGVGSEQVLWQCDDGTAGNRLRATYESDGHIHVVATSGGVTQADLDLGAVAVNTSYGLALRAANHDFAASLNGGAVATDTSGTMPSGLTTERIGSGTVAGNECFCAIRWRGEWGFADGSDGDLQALSVNR